MKAVKAPAGKLPLIESVAEPGMRLSGRHLADYGAPRGRHDFTQRQLLTCLILRAALKTPYRGVLELLRVSPPLRQSLGLTDKLPHFTTLQKFSVRSQVVAIVQQLIATIGQAAAQQEPTPTAAAMDATGLSTRVASEYFRNRTGSQCHQWVKVSVVVRCGSLVPLGLVVGLGPSNDRSQAAALSRQAQAVARPETLYADGG